MTADVLGFVAVRRYGRAAGIRREQDVTILCFQLERVERPIKCWKAAKQLREMRHVSFSRA